MSSSASSIEAQIEHETDLSSSIGVKIERTRRSTSQRRLDQLAWLLEGADTCAAVAVMGQRFYIASNGFFFGTENRNSNQQLNYVCNVMEYFQSIANEEAPKIERNALIMLVLERQITTFKGGVRIPEDILKTVVSSGELLTENWTDLLSLEKHKNVFSGKKDLFYMAVGLASMIFKRLMKIEDSIKKANKKDFAGITEEQLNAFKNFRFIHRSQAADAVELSHSNILLLEKEAGVHAELQILSEYIKMVNTKTAHDNQVYIGISKRCCLQCHTFLDAANQHINNRVIFGGAHDGRFEGGWVLPCIFEVVHASRRSQTKTLQTRLEDTVRENYVIAYNKLKKKEEPLRIFDQRQTPSNSEASYDAEDKFKIYKQRLEDDFEVVDRLQQSSNAAKMLEIGLLACKTEPFEALFIKLLDNVSLDNKETQAAEFFTMLNRIQSVEPAEFLQFLQNERFTNHEIAAYFEGILLDQIVQMSMSEAEINVYAQKLTEDRARQIDELQLTPRSKNALLNKFTFT